MEVFKFGGASVKDAKGVRNFLSCLRALNIDNGVIVISAMGKMTNSFEEIVYSYFRRNPDLKVRLKEALKFHLQIIQDLDFKDDSQLVEVIKTEFKDLKNFLKRNHSTDHDYVYDQVVSRAEILSTKINSAYLHENGFDHDWLDVRSCLKTNSEYRRARVDWDLSADLIHENIDQSRITLTQGFIASDNHGRTTTLGREGSDYTAGILAYCLEAQQVSIFKDVKGVLNADPREFEQTTLIEQISYKEAIEMAFYGASVIHPKTLQPLQRKEIPLNVRSFNDVSLPGTRIEKGIDIEPRIPCFIVKKNQILLSVSDKEFHFVMEDDISKIFRLLHHYKIKVNMIQNSAISFSVCIEDNFDNFNKFLKVLQPQFKVLYNEGLTLYTIRHFDSKAREEIQGVQEVLLEQRSRETLQLIVKK